MMKYFLLFIQQLQLLTPHTPHTLLIHPTYTQPLSRVSPQLRNRVSPTFHGRLKLNLHVPGFLRRARRETGYAQGNHRGGFVSQNAAHQTQRQAGSGRDVRHGSKLTLQHPELVQRLPAVSAVLGVSVVPVQLFRQRLYFARVVLHPARPAHAPARVLVHPGPEPRHAGVRRGGQVVARFPVLFLVFHSNLHAVHRRDVLVAQGVRAFAVHAVHESFRHERRVGGLRSHVPPERGVDWRANGAGDPVYGGYLAPPRALHRGPLVRLELGEHQAPPGCGGGVQNLRGKVPAVFVRVLAPARTRRRECPDSRNVQVAVVVPAVLHPEPALRHAVLHHVKPGHRRVRDVFVPRPHAGCRVVPGVQPLRVRRVELVFQ
mmetsp:Transcript_1777/g.6710  ORF Transcript_1777/g.6710 Transcript_1777/m.6710 type:complete len:374 (+) Transcript_1777:3108-4229(+)